MATLTPVAHVSAVQGKVFAKGENGALRLLKAGDPVFEGDVLIASDGARLELATGQGTPIVLQGNETVLVDADVAGGFRPDASDSALLSARADVDRILKAINEGGSLDELLEETAAGNAAGGTDGGPTFVRLLRIVENVDPLNFEFGTARRGVLDDPISGGGDDSDPPPTVVADDVNAIDPGQATVRERGLLSPADTSETVTGTITVRAPGGLTGITIGGTTLTSGQLAGLAGTPQFINTGEGTLTLTGYDAATGRLAYSYTLNGPVDQPGASATTDSIAITATSAGGTASTSLNILIVDSVPVAQPDSRAISEDAAPNTLSGNVFDNDDIGADVAANPVTPTAGTIVLSYGSFQLNADGSYSYTLDNANSAVNALKTGQALTETYTYTITDADGDASTATLTITINGNTDGPPSIVPVDGNAGATGQATVNEQGLTSGGDTSETTTGTITVSAPDGLASVVIGGVPFTAAQLADPLYLAANPINTGTGTLTLTGFNPVTGALSYSYTLNGPVNQPGATATADPIMLTINDLGGDSATGTLVINILDTVPVANADANAVTEDAAPNPVSGNVITTGSGSDALGADATTVTGVAAGTPASAIGNVGGAGVAGTYGTLVLNADGSYSYTLDNANPAVNALKTGQALTETYTYTITDADGDASTATLTITINGNTDGPPSIVPVDGNAGATGQATVNEQGLTSGGDTSETTTGTITVSAPDGLASVVIGGVPFTAAQLADPLYLAANPINTGTGTLTLTGFNPVTGALSYSYTLNGPVNQPGATATADPIMLTINDLGGDSATGTLVINILDTVPVANADANAVTEDAAPNPISGNVITTGSGSDALGADATTVTGVAVGTPASAIGNVGGAGVAGTYGTLVLNADGSYSYALDNANPAVQALNAGQTTTDVFTYTITDADGDPSTATLTVTLTGTNDLVTVTVPDVNGVTPGQLSVREDLTTTGSFTLNAPDGLDPSEAVQIAGTWISKAALEASGTTSIAITTPQGVLTVTGYNPTTGVVSYSYDPSGTAKDHTGGDVLDTISIVVKDDSGDTASSNLVINILDTVPVANADANAVTEDTAPNPVSGNVITTGSGSDALGADATTVTGVAVGTPASAIGNVGGAGVAGTYGTLVLNADGSYSYALDNANPAVQALNAGQTTTDVFTYTITDADGDPSTATLTVTLTGTNDLVTVTVPDVNGVTPGQLSVREDLTTTGSFTLNAPDGLDPSEAVQIAGTWISKAALEASGTTSIAITTPQGVLTVTGYNPTTGVVSYSYDPSGTAKDHTGGDVLDTISIVVKDDSGDTASSNLVINILDTVPVANADANAVTEDTAPNPVSGNVITTGSGSDALGADATTVTGVAVGTPASAIGNVGGAGVAGTYGTLVLNADGSYSYALDNANPAVQALNAGQTTTDVFTYTITDADGDPSTATLTVTLTGTNDLVTVTVPDVNGVTPGQLSVREDLTTTGSFTLNAPDGLDPSEAVQIAGTWISKAALEASGTTSIAITTPQGVLTVTGYNPTTGVVSYSYDPSGTAKDHTGGDVLDTISIVVKDDSGDTASSNLVINILDTVPVANADANAVTEDTAPNPVSGNVITTGSGSDALGADATTVTGVAVGTPASAIGNVGGAGVAGTYGTLVLNADGSYSYALDNANPAVQALNAGQTTTDVFTYTITDADGDPSTATLTVTLTGTNDLVTVTVPDVNGVTPGQLSVREDLTTTGSFTLNAPDGLDPSEAVQIAGTWISKAALEASGTTSIAITTPQGVLTVTGYNPTTGVVSYSYDPSGTAKDHTGGDVLDTISIVVKDDSGDTASSNLVINILDTVPVANADANAVTEDTAPNPVSGNVITTGSGSDALGADATTVTGVAVGTPASAIGNVGGAGVAGTYGTLVLNADGSYSYALDNANPAVQALNAGQTTTDVFTYTITDADGDPSTATLTVTLTGTNDLVTVTVPDVNGVTPGQLSVREDLTTTGSFTLNAPDGLDPSEAVQIAGTWISKAALEASGTTSIAITTPQGVLTVTGYNPTTGVVSYSYDPSGTAKDHTGGDVLDTISIVVKDDSGDTASSNLVINILDTVPVANADANAVTEDTAPNPVSGNVITTGSGSDALGADATTVTGVAVGTPASAIGNVGGAGVAGTYGTLVLNADGSYSYALDNANPAVQALNAGQTTTDVFTYTITDADGDPSTATLTVTLTGTNDLVTVTVPDVNGVTPGQLSVREDLTTTGSFTLNAPDGLDPSEAVQIAGTWISKAALEASGTTSIAITTPQGVLTVTGYNPTTGVVSYSYDPSGTAKDHTGGDVLDTISIVVKDDSGDTASSNLVINILDTVPVANADANAVTEDTAPNPVSGNVITTGSGSDALGADATTVTGVAVGTPASAIGNVGGAGVAGTYGTLVLNADGSYSYALDNANPAVQALNAGQTTTDVFTYTITDADGDPSTATLTVTLTGTNDLVTVTVPDVNGVTPGQLSVREDLTTTGSFTLNAPDGLDPSEAVQIAGTWISKAALEASGTTSIAITTPQGVLTVTGYNPTTGVVSYSYDPSGTAKDHTGGDVLDTISIVVKDDSGDTASSNLVINILDTVPVANADANAVTEDTAPNPVSGNVITTGSGSDALGADATTVTGVAVGTPASAIGNVGGAGVAGTYGTLVLNADGSYSYALDNANPAVQALNAGQTTTDVFTYTITDADGDPSTATLTVTLTGTNDLVTVTVPDVNGVTPGQLSVREDLTTTGSFTLNAPDGLDPSEAVQIAGTWISKAALEASGTTSIAITTPQGVLTVTGYNPTTGVVSYSYDPSGTAKDHTGGDVLDTISIVVKDDSGDTASSNLVINILDTVPVANADANAVTEDTAPNPVSGNVITTGSGSDALGADATTVTGVAVGTPASAIGNVGGAGVAGTYGTLVLNADGSYSYALDNANPAVQALNAGQTTTDVFTYTITDADGDPSTATLTVTLTGTNDLVTVTVPDVNGVTPGQLSVREDLTTTGSFTLNAPDGLDPSEAVQIAGTWISKAALEASGTTSIAITTPQGVLTVTGYNPTTGVVSYSYDPSGTAKDHTGGDVLDTISIVVKDDSGDTASSNLVINILDTVPVANADANAVTEDTAPNPVSGNVITTGSGSDALGADATTVTGVAVGTPASAIGNVGGAGVAGTYGTLVLNADGSYSYALDNANPAVQALNAGQTTTDVFTYTITDADGDPSTATLTVTLTGTNDLVTVTVPDVNGVTPGQLSVREDLTTTGSFTLNAPDGLDPSEAVQIAGTWISKAALEASGTTSIAITTPQGVLTVTGYNPTTGVVSYSYDPSGTAKDHTGGDVLDTISIVVKDDSGDTASSNLVINILDTVPVANADANAVTEDTAPNPVSGNVITTGSGSDALGADATTVTGVAVGTPASAIGNVGGAGVAGTYGTLVLNADGSYSYALDNANPAVQALNAGQTTTDVFTYTITDADGDPSTATLTVTLTGTNDLVTVTVPDVNGVTPGQLSVREDLTTTGSFTLNAPDGLDPSEAVQIAGTWISKAALEASGTTSIAITTPQGVLTVTGYNPTTGVVSYSYDPSGTAKDHTGGDVLDTISIVVKDDSGDTASSNLVINILDTVPVANADANAVTEDTAPNPVSGNVITTGSGSDALGADATTVTGVAAGTPASAIGNVGGAGVAGTYGTLVLNADGSYSYALDNANPAVQALARNQAVSDTFTYTVTDADGDPSTTTLTVTLTGTNDAPDITVGAGDSTSAGLTETNAGLTASGTLSIFDVDTQDTVTHSVNSVTASYSGPGVMPLTNAQLLAMFSVSGTLASGAQSAPSGITWNFNSGMQAFNFLPNGQTLTLTYNVRATDSSGAANNTDNQPVTITITGTNDGIVANSDLRSIAENANVANRSGNVLTNDIVDPDLGQPTTITSFSLDHNGDGIATLFTPGTPVTVTSASGGTLGVFTMAANGAYSFTPHLANYSGPVPVISYIAGSAGGDSASSTLTITVTPVSDAPGLTRDSATVITNEDTAVALGLNAPTVTDRIDQTGPAAGDNPERLSLVTLTGIPSGVRLLDATNGDASLFASTGGAITIRLSDATNLIASPGTATLTMTTAQFEALKLLPVAHSATNFTVTMRVTEYEVDNAGNPLSGVAGVAATTSVVNNVLAVTDPIDLRIAGGNGPHSVTINEDAALNLTSLLSATFQDLDGSERRDIIIANPVGNGIIYVNVNGTVHAVAAGGSHTIAWDVTGNNLETLQTGFPAISITTAANFSGDLNGITVTLSARDNDSDSPAATPATLTDSVTLNLHVTPVAGDVSIAAVSTPEDTGVRFLNALALTDTDGSETITGITVNAVPAGWVIRDENGVVVFTGTGAAAYAVPAGEVANGDFRNYTITPAAHSSADQTLSIAVQTTDTRIVNGIAVTSINPIDLSQTITVTAVAERVGTDSNADGTPDLTMNASFNYSTAGAEDQWFELATDGFDFRTPWTNQDADGSERSFALLTPVLSGGSAIGSQFQYTLGGVTTTLTYTGTPLQIPMDALDMVRFRAAPNVAGSFEIQVQALTIDTDPNSSVPVQAVSGSATLTNLVIAPVADPVTLAVDAPASGLEDNAIPLVIRPTSADPSETFNVTISGIPAGAVINYNGVVQTATAGAVTINGFSSSLPLTITPPLHSNADFSLSVSARSVDVAAGLTSISDATLPLSLLVDVRGVADPVTLTLQTLQTSETVVDGNSQRIPLAGAVTLAVPVDADGSESLTLTITDIPSGIDVSGLTFLGGIGSSRIWSGTPAQIAGAELVVRDAHFSGTINFSIRAVLTENDGNSLTGPTLPVRIEVAPSPEAVIAAQTTVLEDARTLVNFALQLPLSDGNETLHSVWISETALVGKPFSLFLGATPLALAVVADGGWYKLTAAQAGNVFVQGAANSDADGSFAIKYEVRDPSNDGSLSATIAQFDATHTVIVNAVTDPTVSTNDYDNSQVIGTTTTLEVRVTVTQDDDAAAGGAKDIDGSERLLYFIIDNVPVGVSVEGGRYIGNTPGNSNTGRWILDTPDTLFATASLEQPIRFALDGTSAQLSNLNQSISIIAHTQDTGGSEQTSTTSWTLRTTPGFIDTEPVPGVPAATITQWAPDTVPVTMAEDAPTPLTAFVDAQITGSSPYAVTITGLPAGSVVTGMLQTSIGGQTVWTAQGSGDSASLQTVLAGIAVTPPPNWNSNQGPFSFSTTLTTYDQGGGRNDASLIITPSVTPVSDAIDLATSAISANEDAAASISLTLANPEDGAASQVIGGKVYIRVDESGMTANGGVLSVGGLPLAQETNPAGLPPGTYYAVNGVSSVSALNFSYQGAPNASGTMAYTAYVLGQEAGAANVTTSQISGNVTISPVNDTVTISAPNVTGSEDLRIPITISASLADSSEAIASITLSNVPNGFLVFAGNGAPGSLAINLGEMAGNPGYKIWGIPLAAGVAPPYIALQPPPNWSGTISGLQVGVWSGEPGLDPVLTTASLDVTVIGVADGIGLTPTLSFGNEGQIAALNLNSVMPDSDGSETATLTVKNLGPHAAFYTGTTLLTAGYDVGTDTYTLSGLTPAQVTDLGVIQKDGNYTLDITAYTVDSPGANASATVMTTLPLNIANVAATSGNDTLLYDGTPLDGLGGVDTVQLRFGENIDFNTAVNPANIERIDLMPSGQNHTLSNLTLADVLDMTDSGKTLTILGDAGDSVALKNGSGLDQWSQTGTQNVDGHVFAVYSNDVDAAVKVLIEQGIQRNIDP